MSKNLVSKNKEKTVSSFIDLQIGDVVAYSFPSSIDLKMNRLGMVYEVDEDALQILRIDSYQSSEQEGIKIKKEDLSEGNLLDECLIVKDKIDILHSDLPLQRRGRLDIPKIDEILRKMAFRIVEKHHAIVHHKSKEIVLGKTVLPCSGRVYDAEEMKRLVDTAFDFWLTTGRFAKEFEKTFAKFLGIRHCLLTNSGSSANLLALSALTSPKLGERRLKPGDEVIAVACAFPATVSPILQNSLVPVFLDVNLGTYNIQADKIEKALSGKTKAIFLAHTLGNPFNLDQIMSIAQKYKLWVIEDNCDALGSQYNGKYTGTFGDIATFSFYPAHHITMGEGGAVITNDTRLKQLIESFRDWGRDCWCEPGHANTCNNRFGWKLGELPKGYDHKYIYSHIGYNLKATDMQAAVGLEQLKKLPSFINSRKRNFKLLYDGLRKYEKYFILPQIELGADPSWFGFLLTVRQEAGFTKNEIVQYLENNKISTRMLFAGNLIKQPCFDNVNYRIYGNLENTDFVMNNTFWVGVYPGLSENEISYILECFHKFFEKS